MYLIQKVVKDIIKEVAEIHNIPVSVATEIITSEFKFVATEIPKGTDSDIDTFKSVMLKYFGTFGVSEGKLNHIRRAHERKLARELDNGEEILHTDD